MVWQTPANMNRPAPMSLHAGLVTSQFVATCEFYFRHFGFAPLEITSDYALLGRADGTRLGVLRAGGEGQPAALVRGTRGLGMWLAFDTDNLDALHEQLRAAGVEIVVDPEFTLAGSRRCVVRDPNGVLIYIISAAGVTEEPSPASPREKSTDEDHIHSVRRVSRD